MAKCLTCSVGKSFVGKIKLALRGNFSEIYNVYPAVDESISLVDMARKLASFDDIDWASLYAFSREPLKSRVGREEKVKLSEKAMECGEMYVLKIKEIYGTIPPEKLANVLGLKVQWLEDISNRGQINFAEFVEPDVIHINMETITVAKKYLTTGIFYGILVDKTIEDILLAHEIFHYLEMQDSDTVFTRNYKIRLWQCLGFANNSRLVCLSEIAAMAFVSKYLKLGYSAYVYEVLLTYFINKQEGYRLYDEICRRMEYRDL
jgi:hypothetical protein